jgi:hypothetical protein
MPEAETTDQVKMIEALQKHFEPSRNMIYERYMYNVCQKYQCETTDQYRCEFGTLREETVCHRLVIGTKHVAARAHAQRTESHTEQSY